MKLSSEKKKRTVLGEIIFFLVFNLQRKLSCAQYSRPNPDWLWSLLPGLWNNGSCECTGLQAGFPCAGAMWLTGHAWFLDIATSLLVQEARRNWRQNWKLYLASKYLIQATQLAKGWSSRWRYWKYWTLANSFLEGGFVRPSPWTDGMPLPPTKYVCYGKLGVPGAHITELVRLCWEFIVLAHPNKL